MEKVKSTLILCYGQVALNAPQDKILNRIDQDILRCISKHFNTKVKVTTAGLHWCLSLHHIMSYIIIYMCNVFTGASHKTHYNKVSTVCVCV